MSKTRITITMSLDGYVAGPNQSVKEPLGVGGEALHDWAVKLAAFNELQGKEGGEVNANSAIFQEMFENVGAVIHAIPEEVEGLRVVPVVVDDGSEDATVDVARAAGALVARHPIRRERLWGPSMECHGSVPAPGG